MRFLPTKVHGALDYLVGIALILAPMVFGFQSVGGAAVWIPRVLGVGLIVYSFFTNYEWGVVKVLPMAYHLVVDFVAAAFLAVSPFLFHFTHQGINAWLPHVVVGVTVLAVVLVSKTSRPVAAEVQQADGAAPAFEPATSTGPTFSAPAPSGPRPAAPWMPGATEADRRAELANLRRPTVGPAR